MSRYTIVHTCKHEEAHNIAQGNATRRAWIAKKRAEKPCSNCSRVAWQAEVDTTNAYYTEISAEQGFPEIHGTERQVPWAVGLRGELLDQVDECLPQLRALCAQHSRPFADRARDVIRELVFQHTDARWWIEHRKQLPQVLAESHRKGLKLSGEAGATAKQLLIYLEKVR